MKPYTAFLKKEFIEAIRTYRILILAAVFLLLGMMSPLTAKLLPELLPSLMESMPEGGVTITVPDPTAMDAYTQMFKNLTQMGLIVLLFVYAGMLSGEIGKGTLINLLTKGLNRNAVILTKYFSSLLIWTASAALMTGVSIGYTWVLFPADAAVPHLFLSVACVWLFGAWLLSLILFSSSVIPGYIGGLALPVLCFFALMFLDILPSFQPLSPIRLVTDNLALLKDGPVFDTVIRPLSSTLLLTILNLFTAAAIFNRKPL
ncbi:ABC transporter permease [Lachnotalea sp. AF33-28]|uniref:ABC transporter permease n=1 Tax=Lachnotalea sp. AF33-28 TaxID=2292046 RepID=UPI000E54AE9E|nr:ABC transporter permease subunit [Lachnotalea sp. AF33-28]RHP30555.1 ABC transporter permease [Lachnotalea sp. AF33-28]